MHSAGRCGVARPASPPPAAQGGRAVCVSCIRRPTAWLPCARGPNPSRKREAPDRETWPIYEVQASPRCRTARHRLSTVHMHTLASTRTHAHTHTHARTPTHPHRQAHLCPRLHQCTAPCRSCLPRTTFMLPPDDFKKATILTHAHLHTAHFHSPRPSTHKHVTQPRRPAPCRSHTHTRTHSHSPTLPYRQIHTHKRTMPIMCAPKALKKATSPARSTHREAHTRTRQHAVSHTHPRTHAHTHTLTHTLLHFHTYT
jgi:hypothetical protein